MNLAPKEAARMLGGCGRALAAEELEKAVRHKRKARVEDGQGVGS